MNTNKNSERIEPQRRKVKSKTKSLSGEPLAKVKKVVIPAGFKPESRF
jgi:hypothetical protein